MLVDFLYRKTEGALLISGKRGVGKTSAVFSAINKVSSILGNDRDTLLPVLINAPSFDIHKINSVSNKTKQIDDNKSNSEQKAKSDNVKTEQIDILEFKRVVLQNIVRRLFNKAEEKELKQKNPRIYNTISELFKRAVAKEVKEETKDEEMRQHNIYSEKEIIMNLGATKKLLGIGVSFLSAALVSLNPIPYFGDWNTVFAILVGIVPATAITISWAVKKTEIKQYGMNRSAASYYLNDFNVTNLQSELEKTLQALDKQGYKVIIIIDELDKMEEEDIVSVISSLKTLFNQSLAKFVLIIGYEYFINMIKRGKDRPTEYTLFSQKIFLSRPLFGEMEEFIDNIIKNKESSNFKENEEDYHQFRNYVCYASKTDFFDLYNVIRDSIEGYDEEDSPLLHVKLTDQKHEIQARLQKVMGQIYSLQAYEKPSDWYKNDLLLDKMYELLTNLTENKVLTIFRIEGQANKKIIFSTSSVTADDEIQSAALLNVMEYLEGLGFLERTKPDEYEIAGKMGVIPPKPNIRTQQQKKFVEEYQKFLFIIFIYANLFSRFSRENLTYQNLTYQNVKDSKEQEILDTIRKLEPIGIQPPMSLSSISELIKTYNRLTKDVSGERREKLERNIDALVTGQKGYLDNFLVLISGILGNLGIKATVLPIQNVANAFQIHLISDTRTASKYGLLVEHSQLIIAFVQNPSPEFRDELQRATVGLSRHVIVFTINRSIEDDFMEKFENPEVQSDDQRVIQAEAEVSAFVYSLKTSEADGRQFLNIKIPVAEKIFTRLIRGIQSWHETTTPPHIGAPELISPPISSEGQQPSKEDYRTKGLELSPDITTGNLSARELEYMWTYFDELRRHVEDTLDRIFLSSYDHSVARPPPPPKSPSAEEMLRTLKDTAEDWLRVYVMKREPTHHLLQKEFSVRHTCQIILNFLDSPSAGSPSPTNEDRTEAVRKELLTLRAVCISNLDELKIAYPDELKEKITMASKKEIDIIQSRATE